ncbi:hypothetical protein N7470_006361 [Penicillium chermesinum]|nr:hypothetical protein N7470_006361 [Penicillium chermesinum]
MESEDHCLQAMLVEVTSSPSVPGNPREQKTAAEVTLGGPAEDVDEVKEDVQGKVPVLLWALIVLTIVSSIFLFSMDNTIVADIQSPIVNKFGEVGKLSWMGVAFVLSSASTMTTWGKLYDIFSAKILYILGVVIFEAGSALCGAAPNMNALIVGRAIAGLGGSGLYLGCLTLIEVTTSVRQRPMYMGFTGITWGLGTVLGPLIGGAFAENRHTTWRWAFYINLVIGGLFAPIYLFFLPMADPQKGVALKDKLRQVDFGNILFPWGSAKEISLWVVGGILLVVFIVQQATAFTTTKANRIFPGDFLRKPIMWILFIAMACASTAVFVPVYYIPLYFQFVLGDSPLTAAVRLLPFVFLSVFCGLLNGGTMSLLGYYQPWYLVGGMFTAIGGGLMSTIDEHSSRSSIYGYSVLIGLGSGLFIQASFAVAQAKVPRARASDATAFIALAQTIGIVLSLAISGSVWQNQSVAALQELLPQLPREQLRGMLSGASDSANWSHIPDKMRAKVIHAIVHAMSHTYYLVVTAGVVTVVAALLMKPERIFMQPGAMA